MSGNTVQLRRQIDIAQNLQSVVRTMKAMAASSINQYEQAVEALADYYRTVELGLGVVLRTADMASQSFSENSQANGTIHVVVFGSDQGMVGQFNEIVVDYTLENLRGLPGKVEIWAVGERVYARLADEGMPLLGHFPVPSTVKAITPLIGQILMESEAHRSEGTLAALHLYYNRPASGSVYEPTSQRVLPLDRRWKEELIQRPWAGKNLPEALGRGTEPLGALIREYLFVSSFRACAESLASENASRLAAMQRADKNIEELLVDLSGSYNRLRQSTIDEELFDVIAGFEALSGKKR